MTENYIDLIADYLNEKLDLSQRADFEKELLLNESLQKETEKLGLLKKIAERNRILEEAKIIHNRELNTLKTPVKVFSWAKIASFTAAASVMLMLYLGNSDVDYIEVSAVERGGDTTQSFITNFEKGVSFLKENKNKEAISEFDSLINNQNIEEYFQDASKWYKVVALAEMDNDIEAQKLLNVIESDNSFKFKISFLDKLKVKLRLFL
jgi:hypothetical protein